MLFNLEAIIFSHDFAKSFWGEEETHKEEECYYGCCQVGLLAYKYHLQQMILEKEPLKYLEKYL